jgi:hypothetical protein
MAFRSASSDFPASDLDTLLQPALPAGTVAGDVLVAVGGCIASRTITPPAGFTQRLTNSNASFVAYLWTKTAVGGDNLDFTVSGTFAVSGVAVLCYSGVTETGLVGATATSAVNDNAAACPSVVTTAPNATVVSAEYTNTGMTATCAGPAERVDANGGAPGGSVAAYDEVQAAAGASGGRTIATSGFARTRKSTHWWRSGTSATRSPGPTRAGTTGFTSTPAGCTPPPGWSPSRCFQSSG